MTLDTIEKREKQKKDLSNREQLTEAELAAHNKHLNNLMYDIEPLADGSDSADDQTASSDGAVPISDRFRTDFLDPGIDASELQASSDMLRNTVPKEELSDALGQGDGIAVDRHNLIRDTEDIEDAANDIMRQGGAGYEHMVSDRDALGRTLGESVDQQVAKRGASETLETERAVEVKNALIGRQYMEAFVRRSDKDIELIGKLPSGVLENVSQGMSQLESQYGSHTEVPNGTLAIIGEVIVSSAGVVAMEDNPEQQMLVYGNAEGELVVQTVDEAVEKLIAGDRTATEAIDNPVLKQKTENYLQSLETFYASGIVGADPNEIDQLKKYLVETFTTRGAVD